MPPEQDTPEPQSRAKARTAKKAPSGDLNEAEGKFLYHLVKVGGVTGGPPASLGQIYESSFNELSEEDQALVRRLGGRKGQRTPKTQNENYITKPMIKQLAFRLQTRRWSTERPPYQDRPYISRHPDGYTLEGDSYITLVLTAKIAFAMQEWTKRHSTQEIPLQTFIDDVSADCKVSTKRVEDRIEWLKEQRYISFPFGESSSSCIVVVDDKMTAQRRYINRVATLPLRDDPVSLMERVTSPYPESSLARSPERVVATAAQAVQTTIEDQRGTCVLLGDDRKAFKHVLERYTPSTREPKVLRLRDAHARAREKPMRFRHLYEELEKGFRGFVEGVEADTIAAIFVFGWVVDRQYMKTIQAAVNGLEDRVEFYRLRFPAPLLSFIILDYDNDTHEVLFGWGELGDGTPGVFASTNKRLVQVFSNYYNALIQSATAVSIEALSARSVEPMEMPARSEQDLTILPKWDQSVILEKLKNSPKDAELRLLTTFFVNDASIFDILDSLLLDSTRKFKVLLMDPRPTNTVLMERRYGTGKPEERVLREGWSAETAAARIGLELRLFEACQGRLEHARVALRRGRQNRNKRKIGTLEVRVYDTVPTLVHYQIGEEIVVGFLLTRRSGDDGPMICVKKGEPLWSVLEENWNTCWEIGTEWPPSDGGG
jgi:hypothetical protein